MNKTKYVKSGSHYTTAITTDRSGRTSIVVSDNRELYDLVDVELPAKTGEFAKSFKPTVRVKEKVSVVKVSVI